MPLGGFDTDYYMTAKEHELMEVSLVRKKVPKKVVIDNRSRVSLCSCGNIFAIDIHHIIEVVKGGGNELANLMALCPVMLFFIGA